MLMLSGWIPVFLGGILVATACYYQFYVFRRRAKDTELPVSMTALRFSYWLGISGLIILFLSALNFMRVIPWWS